MARSAMRAAISSLAVVESVAPFHRVQEAIFWCVVAAGLYGVYLLLTAL